MKQQQYQCVNTYLQSASNCKLIRTARLFAIFHGPVKLCWVNINISSWCCWSVTVINNNRVQFVRLLCETREIRLNKSNLH